MINGVHVMTFAHDAEKARAFFRDTLKFPSVDAGEGWLIFALPPSEIAAHPGDAPPAGAQPRCEIYLMCDDIEATVQELQRKGVEFTSPVTDQGWGLVTTLEVPGAGQFGLYQPRHPVAHKG